MASKHCINQCGGTCLLIPAPRTRQQENQTFKVIFPNIMSLYMIYMCVCIFVIHLFNYIYKYIFSHIYKFLFYWQRVGQCHYSLVSEKFQCNGYIQKNKSIFNIFFYRSKRKENVGTLHFYFRLMSFTYSYLTLTRSPEIMFSSPLHPNMQLTKYTSQIHLKHIFIYLTQLKDKITKKHHQFL